ncbi:hypothetical protein QR680_002923 [Steinernema hermaphroditum]|uniref:Uncharacterized protein n=1 Tax=Steinernema hermaphroditum TaxID=289476 RepID=A0AA39H4N6_9BILA|nr:hypothetical protein QR680_002923 [Steinernema hermaphroditum]
MLNLSNFKKEESVEPMETDPLLSERQEARVNNINKKAIKELIFESFQNQNIGAKFSFNLPPYKEQQESRFCDVYKEGPWIFTHKVMDLAVRITCNHSTWDKVKQWNINLFTLLAEIIVLIREDIRYRVHVNQYYLPPQQCYPNAGISKVDCLVDDLFNGESQTRFVAVIEDTIRMMLASEIKWRDAYTVVSHFQKHRSLFSTLRGYYNMSLAMTNQKEASVVDAPKDTVVYADHLICYTKKTDSETDKTPYYIRSHFDNSRKESDGVCKRCEVMLEEMEMDATCKILTVLFFLEKCRQYKMEPYITYFKRHVRGTSNVDTFLDNTYIKFLYMLKAKIKSKECCGSIIDEFRTYHNAVDAFLRNELESKDSKIFNSDRFTELPFIHFGPEVLLFSTKSKPKIANDDNFKDINKVTFGIGNSGALKFLGREFPANFHHPINPVEEIMKDQDYKCKLSEDSLLKNENVQDLRKLQELSFIHGAETFAFTTETQRKFTANLGRCFLTYSAETNRETEKITNNLITNNANIKSEDGAVIKADGTSGSPSVDKENHSKIETSSPNVNEEIMSTSTTSVTSESSANSTPVKTSEKRKAKKGKDSPKIKSRREAQIVSNKHRTTICNANLNNVDRAREQAKQIMEKAEIKKVLSCVRIGAHLIPAQRSEEQELSGFRNEQIDDKILAQLKAMYDWKPPLPSGKKEPKAIFKRWMDVLKNEEQLLAKIHFNPESLILTLCRSRRNMALDCNLLPDRTAFCRCGKCQLVPRLKASQSHYTDFCCQEAFSTKGNNYHVERLQELSRSGCITDSTGFWSVIDDELRKFGDLSDLSAQKKKQLSTDLNRVLYLKKGLTRSHIDRWLPACVVAGLRRKLRMDIEEEENRTTASVPDEDAEDHDDDLDAFDDKNERKTFTIRYKNHNTDNECVFSTLSYPPKCEATDRYESLQSVLGQVELLSCHCHLITSTMTDFDDDTTKRMVHNRRLLQAISGASGVNVFVHRTMDESLRMFMWKVYANESAEMSTIEAFEALSKQGRVERAIFLKETENGSYRSIDWEKETGEALK